MKTGDCLSFSSNSQMKRDIYSISIHAELQPRANEDGEGDAEQIKEQSETKCK